MTHRTKAAVLSILLLVCGIGFVVTQRLREQLPPPAPRELFSVVNEQLTAFRSADYQSAYRHAAAGVQQRFTLPQFERWIQQRYPETARLRRVEYGLVRVHGGNAVVQVYFLSEEGRTRSFLYSLTREDDGWKVDGAEEVDPNRTRQSLGGTRA